MDKCGTCYLKFLRRFKIFTTSEGDEARMLLLSTFSLGGPAHSTFDAEQVIVQATRGLKKMKERSWQDPEFGSFSMIHT